MAVRSSEVVLELIGRLGAIIGEVTPGHQPGERDPGGVRPRSTAMTRNLWNRWKILSLFKFASPLATSRAFISQSTSCSS